MNLQKITDLTNRFGISSRSLRFYEQAGLIKSVRPDFEKYRYYDEANIERLKQIMVLRKMQIPIRDISRIYENEDMSVVVKTFVNRIHAIDEEVGALSELRVVVNDFLQEMLQSGVKKITALPLLYEKMEKRLDLAEKSKTGNFKKLSALSEKLSRPMELSIIHLPPCRVISSYLKSNPDPEITCCSSSPLQRFDELYLVTSDADGFWQWLQARGIPPGEPGMHECFEFQTNAGEVIILKVPEDFSNTGPYFDYTFEGGLFAAANVYLDEDLGERFRSLLSMLDNSKYYELDYAQDGGFRHEVMLENLISPDEKRELVSWLVPVKKRVADPGLFEQPYEISPDSITIEEIEAQNPVLWDSDIPLDKLTPINNPHYRMTEYGEAEYTGWISTRVLSTNTKVRLPFRVDIEFRAEDKDALFGFGADEGSICVYHGSNLNYVFGVNMGNRPDEQMSEESICFHQPIFKNFFSFPKRGKINRNEYNRLTWIIGDKHLAVTINGEIRYCGVNFPYMMSDMRRGEAQPIIIGSNGQGRKYFKSIRVSQLAGSQKNKIKEGVLSVITKRSNNIIPNIHRLVTNEYGENYWFNGCAKYVMECLGEPDYDYQFFAGLTGDVFANCYPIDRFHGDGLTDNMINIGNIGYAEEIFKKCGYASTFVFDKDLCKNTEMYLQTLTAYIDKGVPVIQIGRGGPPIGVYVGYEDYGKVLLHITGNNDEPERITLETALTFEAEVGGWIFVGEKRNSVELAGIYRDAILNLPKLLTSGTDYFHIGSNALRAWAGDIENGKFDGMKPEQFDIWTMHTSYVCSLATNGSCCHEFLRRARELNPDMAYLEDVSSVYKKTADMWNNQSGEDLEALGGGFNVTLENLQSKEKRGKIAAKIRECADCVDKVIDILSN